MITVRPQIRFVLLVEENPGDAEYVMDILIPTGRYVEIHGEMRRGLTVLKMRGTFHEKEIREYIIDGEGLHIKEPFRGVHGILTGTPTYTFGAERSRLTEMFGDESAPRV